MEATNRKSGVLLPEIEKSTLLRNVRLPDDIICPLSLSPYTILRHTKTNCSLDRINFNLNSIFPRDGCTTDEERKRGKRLAHYLELFQVMTSTRLEMICLTRSV